MSDIVLAAVLRHVLLDEPDRLVVDVGLGLGADEGVDGAAASREGLERVIS